MSEIGLFRRLPGTDLFASRVKSGSTIELGENVQLRSIVRGGDGKMSNFNYNLVRRWRHFISNGYVLPKHHIKDQKCTFEL